jgi:hypothetical protein
MKRIIIIAALLLAGCSDNPPEPRSVCTQVTGVYACGKGGTCKQCGNWEIGCPKPLELRERADGSGQLICRIKRKSDTCLLTTDKENPDRCDGSK